MIAAALPLISCPPADISDDSGFGCLRTAHGALPLAAFTAALRVAGPVYRWDLRQVFVNNGTEAIEAVYIFPLPPRGAVTAFRLKVAGREVVGELQERGQARAEYQTAIAEGKRAALLEEDRPDVFTVQVGNILAGEHAEVVLELSGPVAVDDGIATVRLPLVVAKRYIPGSALGDDVGDGTIGDTDAVPDASRISPPVLLPGFKSPVRLGITIAIAGAVSEESAGGDLGCSLPTVPDAAASTNGVHAWRVVPGQRLDRDCIVRWKVGAAALSAQGFVAQNAPDGGATIAVTIMPPADAQNSPRKPQDVVILLDRSGSMEGWKMIAARRAAARLVDSLGPDDRFAALAFDDSVAGHDGAARALHAGHDRARFAAVTWLATVDARGGTEMTLALDTAFALLKDDAKGRERVLVLITDGQIGDEDRLLKKHAKSLANVRVVALGIDQAVNESLLQRMAAPNGGWVACVENEDWLDQVLAGALRAVRPAVLQDITVECSVSDDGKMISEALPAITPDPIPDAWPNRPLTLWARVPMPAPAKLTVHGITNDGTPWSQSVPLRALDEPALHAAWARGRIRDLEDRHAVRSDPETAAEILRVSLAEKVLSRFTAFIAVDHDLTGNTKLRTVVQAVEAVADSAEQTRSSAIGGAMRMRNAPAAAASGGAGFGSVPPPAQMAAPVPASPAMHAPSVSRGPGGPLKKFSRKLAGKPQQQPANMMAEEEASIDVLPPAPPADPLEAAAALRALIEIVAKDGIRLALTLRASATREAWQRLREALDHHGHTALRERLDALRTAIDAHGIKPALVAAVWPELRSLLDEVAQLPPAAGSQGATGPSGPAPAPKPGRRDGKFWV
jgi:Ca-activated chloride channel family protein